MKLFTSEQMKHIDRYAIDTLQIPSVLLMRNAACSVSQEAMRIMENDSVAVFCGSGNNGGDGIGAACYLKERGLAVRVFLTGNREKMTPDSLAMEEWLKNSGGTLEEFDTSSADMRNFVDKCGVIIDAMFGVGLHSDMRGNALEAVQLINSSPAPVVAADIASGVQADTGKILGAAVKADITVTFTGAKPGHFSEPGCYCCGRLVISDIGIPKQLCADAKSDVFAVFEEDISLPKRAPNTHKGSFGRDLILGGSIGYTGAPLLSSRAAVRSGAGLTYLGVPEKIYSIAAAKCLEEMPFPLPCDEAGHIALAAKEQIFQKLAACSVCLIGPGLGRTKDLTKLMADILSHSKIPLVIDADGINAVSENINVLDEASCPVILTPHEGEFARLGGDLASQSRLEAARHFAVSHHCTLVLKGHRTVSAFPDGQVFINTTGNPGMAKGGSGDVLSGIIASLVGQKLAIKEAVCAGVYIHSKAGDLCRDKFGEYFMTPSDLISMLSEVMKK